MPKIKKKSVKPQRATKLVRSRALTPVASGAKQEYKRLLLDPCNADLIRSPYGNDAGQATIRDHSVFNNATAANIVFFHPVLGVFVNDGSTPEYLKPLWGTDYMIGNTRRPVAGCLDAMFTGAENLRAGTVYCTVVPGANVYRHLASTYGGGSVSIPMSSLASYFTNVSRMPVDRCSVNWFPTSADAEWYPSILLSNANSNALEVLFAKTHFCAVFVDAPLINSIRFSATRVTDFVPSESTVVANNASAIPWGVSANTAAPVDYQTVLRELASQDSNWYLDTFKKVAKFGLGLVTNVVQGGLPGALGYLTREMSGSTTMGGKKGRNFIS